MNLIPFNRNSALSSVPFGRNFNSMIDDVEQHMQRLVDSFFQPSSLNDLKSKFKNTGYPRIDVYTKEESYVIQATVPGVNPDELVIEMLDTDGEKYVRLTGQMSETYRVDEATWTHKEIHRRAFERVLSLPDYIEGEPTSKLKTGLLTLTWKIKSKDIPNGNVKKIAVNVE